MRPEGNPLDLNNLPDEYSRDGKQVVEDNSSPGCRKKKSGGVGGSGNKEECGKVYECRFCSLKFCKSQALGGHMNRHRQERETETLNQARQLVFRNDHTLAQQAAPHLGCCPPPIAGDPTVVGMRFPRYFSAGSSSTHIPPPPPSQSYLYAGPSAPPTRPFPSHFPPPHHHDYYVGHVMPNYVGGGESSNNYTCIGAPVGGAGRGMEPPPPPAAAAREGSSSEEAGINWGRTYSSNRFHDGF